MLRKFLIFSTNSTHEPGAESYNSASQLIDTILSRAHVAKTVWVEFLLYSSLSDNLAQNYRSVLRDTELGLQVISPYAISTAAISTVHTFNR